MARAGVDAFESNRKRRQEHGGLMVRVKRQARTYSNAEKVGEVGCSSFAAGPSLQKVRDVLKLSPHILEPLVHF